MATIEGGNYKVDYDPKLRSVEISGVLRLNGPGEYAPIVGILNEALGAHRDVTLDLTRLEFLNSSGIGMLMKFVIEARKQDIRLKIQGSNAVPWQGK